VDFAAIARMLTELQRRQQMVGQLLQESDLLGSIRAELKSIGISSAPPDD